MKLMIVTNDVSTDSPIQDGGQWDMFVNLIENME